MGSYKDFLQMLGISHLTFLFILIIAFLVFGFVSFLSKMGYTSNIKFSAKMFPKSNIIYCKFVGKYEFINSKIEDVITETKPFFKLSDLFAIYFAPRDNENPAKMEAIIGILVKDIEEHQVAKFLNKNKSYQTGQLPKTKCIGTKYPYFNKASLVMIFQRVYPKLKEFVELKKLEVGPEIIEVYHLMSEKPYVEILAPLENVECFELKR